MKYLITFEKGESARWLGHLDILRTFERAIRRAELPIAFTTGFNPRERIAFASALGVGITGSAEPATIELTAPLPPSDILDRLNVKLPPGIRIRSAEEIPDAGSRDLLNSFDRAVLRVVCDSRGGAADLDAAARACAALLAESSVIIEREREGRVKPVDIRPYVHALRAEGLEGARIVLGMELAVGQEGTVRAAEVVTALQTWLPDITLRRAHRVCLLVRGAAAALSQ